MAPHRWQPITGRDAEVSWLGVIAGGAFPPRSYRSSGLCRGLAADSCGGSAGLAPDFPVASQCYRSTPLTAAPTRSAPGGAGAPRGRRYIQSAEPSVGGPKSLKVEE